MHLGSPPDVKSALYFSPVFSSATPFLFRQFSHDGSADIRGIETNDAAWSYFPPLRLLRPANKPWQSRCHFARRP